MEQTEQAAQTEQTQKAEEKYGVSRYFLLTMLLSFLGWAFETTYVWILSGRLHNQGFMTLPFCPIYGCSLIVVYFLVGTPDHGGLLLKNVTKKANRYPLYVLFAFLIPSLAELLVGAFFDYTFHLTLWSYSTMPMNFRGYVCLPVSLAWLALIFLFMKFLFPPLRNAIGKIPAPIARTLAFCLLFIVAVDASLNFAMVMY